MLDFTVQKFTRRCAASERELKPGEAFYSVLVPEGSDVVRLDYSEQHWQGPPENALGWWKSEVPDPKATRINWAPNDVMMHYFEQLREDPTKQDLCYVLVLLMLRRRIFRLDATETSETGEESLVIYCARNETEYQIPVVSPTAERVEEIQRELSELLFARAD